MITAWSLKGTEQRWRHGLASASELDEQRRLTLAARSQLHAVLGSWLQVQTVADPHPAVAAHHGLEPDGLGDEARDELFRFVDFVVYDSDGTFGDLLTDKTAFAFSDRLAKLYAGL